MSSRWFLLKRLHSASGLFPIGAYLCFHLFANSFATRGPEAYNRLAHFLEDLPYVTLVAAALIWIPILFHSLLGLYLWRTGAFNALQYGYLGNWMYVLQRVTGGLGLVFIALHWMQTRGANLFFGRPIEFSMMQQIFRSPWHVAIYLVGVLSLVFHFANGVRTALITWGITVGPNAQRLGYYLGAGIFVVLSCMSLASIAAFTRGS